MRKYVRRENIFGVAISYEEDGKRVVFNETPGNTDYEEYLEWVAEGNTAEVVEG